MSNTYTVFRLLAAEAEVSGLPLEQAVDAMMREAGCKYQWVTTDSETRIDVWHYGAAPGAYAYGRHIKSPYFRSTNRDSAAARAEILRGFLRTGLLGVRIIADENAARIREEVKDALLGSQVAKEAEGATA